MTNSQPDTWLIRQTVQKQLSTNQLKADKPDEMKARNIRREQLILYLPECNWSIGKAGVKAGYTRYYAYNRLPTILQEDVSFCEAVEKIKADIKLQTDFKAADIKRELWIVYRDPKSSQMVKNRCLELLGKSIAMYVDRGITETPDQARNLSEAEQVKAKRLAIHLMTEEERVG